MKVILVAVVVLMLVLVVITFKWMAVKAAVDDGGKQEATCTARPWRRDKGPWGEAVLFGLEMTSRVTQPPTQGWEHFRERLSPGGGAPDLQLGTATLIRGGFSVCLALRAEPLRTLAKRIGRDR